MRRDARSSRATAERLSTNGPIAAPVEREVWVRAGMFGAIIVLVALILATPSLMGHPPALASLPILVIGVTPASANPAENLTVYVAASVQAYLYREIAVNVTRLNDTNATVAWTNLSQPYTYGMEAKAPLNLSRCAPTVCEGYRIHVWLLDQQDNYFEYNVSGRVYYDQTTFKLTLAFQFPDDSPTTVVTRVPPDDLRVAIPRRGTLP